MTIGSLLKLSEVYVEQIFQASCRGRDRDRVSNMGKRVKCTSVLWHNLSHWECVGGSATKVVDGCALRQGEVYM